MQCVDAQDHHFQDLRHLLHCGEFLPIQQMHFLTSVFLLKKFRFLFVSPVPSISVGQHDFKRKFMFSFNTYYLYVLYYYVAISIFLYSTLIIINNNAHFLLHENQLIKCAPGICIIITIHNLVQMRLFVYMVTVYSMIFYD